MTRKRGDPTRVPELTTEGINTANQAWMRLAVIYGCGWTDRPHAKGFPPFPLEHRQLVMRGMTHYLKEYRSLYSYGEIMRLLNVPDKEK